MKCQNSRAQNGMSFVEFGAFVQVRFGIDLVVAPLADYWESREEMQGIIVFLFK